jgi:hypothetical protein
MSRKVGAVILILQIVLCVSLEEKCNVSYAPRTYGIPYPEDENPNKLAIAEATKAGELAAKKGKEKMAAAAERKALDMFRGATIHAGFRGDIWSNVALASKTVALRILAENGDKHEALTLLRDSIAAADVGIYFQNANSAEVRASAVGAMKHYFKKKCLATSCKRYKAEIQALGLMKKDKNEEAANLLCKSVNQVTVELTDQERRLGIISGETMRSLWIGMRVCGVVLVTDLFEPAFLAQVREAQAVDFDEYLRSEEKGEETTDAASRELGVERSEAKRFEVKFPYREPYTHPELYANRFVVSLAKSFMSKHIQIDTFSTVTSLPGNHDISPAVGA